MAPETIPRKCLSFSDLTAIRHLESLQSLSSANGEYCTEVVPLVARSCKLC